MVKSCQVGRTAIGLGLACIASSAVSSPCLDVPRLRSRDALNRAADVGRAEASHHGDRYPRIANAMLGFVALGPKRKRTECVIMGLELGGELLPLVLLGSRQGGKPLLHSRWSPLVFAKAGLDDFRDAASG